MSTQPKIAYTLAEAADAASVSIDTLRRAIRATDPSVYPPPLRAKRTGTEKRPAYRIQAAELQAWIDSLPDA